MIEYILVNKNKPIFYFIIYPNEDRKNNDMEIIGGH